VIQNGMKEKDYSTTDRDARIAQNPASQESYQGNFDPADEASVYGLKTNTGFKGILIAGDGIYSNTSTKVLKKLHSKINIE
jgi:hypothetical protein